MHYTLFRFCVNSILCSFEINKLILKTYIVYNQNVAINRYLNIDWNVSNCFDVHIVLRKLDRYELNLIRKVENSLKILNLDGIEREGASYTREQWIFFYFFVIVFLRLSCFR